MHETIEISQKMVTLKRRTDKPLKELPVLPLNWYYKALEPEWSPFKGIKSNLNLWILCLPTAVVGCWPQAKYRACNMTALILNVNL